MEIRSMITDTEREQMAKYGHIILDDNKPPIESDIEYKKNGLVIKGDLPYDHWETIGQTLQNMHGALGWWIGDWLNYGESHYGETYAQAIEATSKNYQTLANYKYVASKIEFSRRRENLSWKLHAEVAGLVPEQQEKVLDICESASQARQLVRELQNKPITTKIDPYEALFERVLATKSKRLTIEHGGQKFTVSLVQTKVVTENGGLINEIIGLFEPINPTFEQLYKRANERQACERLITKFGIDKVRQMVKELPAIIHQPYAPTVTTPVQLETNLGKIIAFIKKGAHGPRVAKIR